MSVIPSPTYINIPKRDSAVLFLNIFIHEEGIDLRVGLLDPLVNFEKVSGLLSECNASLNVINDSALGSSANWQP